MKNSFLLAGIFLAGVGLVAGMRRRKPGKQPAGLTSSLGAQQVVVYPVGNLTVAVKWYNVLFQPQLPTYSPPSAKYPYALYTIDGISVYLSTDPDYLRLKEPVFYWTLADPAAVTAMIDYLKKQPDVSVRFKENKHPIHVGKPGTPQVDEVQKFVVIDPDNNLTAVINNPIYPPKVQLRSC